MNITLSIFDVILNDINKQQMISVTKDDAQSLRDAIHRLDVEGLIYEKNQSNVYWLTKDGFKVLELGGFEKWREFITKPVNNPSKNINVFGNFSITDSKVNLLSDNSSINSPDEVLEQLGNMIELLRQNQSMDVHFKAKLIDMNEELQKMINISKESNLPIMDNLISIASNFSSLFGS
jgi:predicted transcriptional regulator